MLNKLFVILLLSGLFSIQAKSQSLQEVYYQNVVTNVINKITGKRATADVVLDFAKDLIGVPYRYASGSPSKGFDCSGFVTYVFRNFGFRVPRSSHEYAQAGKPVKLADAKPGDVILFTGTNSRVRRIGHVGIITSVNNGEVEFIHSSSGREKGVTITSLNEGYYKRRLMKVVSLL
ncbi:NlpC/P60 family protein [Pedobacter yulinensis]|uniref:NlpC/P60 family protein n=1 Tax=Pedobacter yulinensis TaxID=2126353 RepID=A0A2T3HIA9_9SPHI|nr:C40 family peptidase [Pedobacter yulinensis]PST82186.1 NlpC/P60 family protein [Pedobacter yulinensis]